MVWEKNIEDRQKHEPQVQRESAVWKYRLSDKRCAVFSANPPYRKWSFDGRNLKTPIDSKKLKQLTLTGSLLFTQSCKRKKELV